MHRIRSLSGEDVLAMQHVKRWHMVRTKRVQTLAEHNGTVALLAVKIAQLWAESVHAEVDPQNTGRVVLDLDQVELLAPDYAGIVEYALTHDAHETEYGDPPSPAVSVSPEAYAAQEKQFWIRRIDWTPHVSEHTRRLVRIADKLEALLFYLLEGEDSRLKTGCENGVKKVCADAPLAVTLWISNLVQNVKNGHFTPQPASPVAVLFRQPPDNPAGP
jgi:5'-deoxynucleotidase YfbR-like HD superfamily hydrolase